MPFYNEKPQADPRKEAEFMQQAQMSMEEVDRMRAILHEQDKRRVPNVFDLSKPPVVPYTFQKFPMTVYNPKGSTPPKIIRTEKAVENRLVVSETHVAARLQMKMVNSEKELEKALKDGWQEKPPVFDSVRTDEY